MPRYIDIEPIIKGLELSNSNIIENSTYCKGYNGALTTIISILKELPTVEVVPSDFVLKKEMFSILRRIIWICCGSGTCFQRVLNIKNLIEEYTKEENIWEEVDDGSREHS